MNIQCQECKSSCLRLDEIINGKCKYCGHDLFTVVFEDETESGVELPCSDLLSCPDKAVEQLIKLAAEMGMRDGMPSEYVSDWPIPKNTPHKTLYEIERNMEIVQKKISDWSYAVRQIANELHKAR